MGSYQQWIALVLLVVVFALIILEVVHRTLVAFMGAAAVLFVLALEHRQGLTLVHVRAQLEQLQDTFMS